jgi:hypothetical protein
MNNWKKVMFNKDLCEGTILYGGTGDLILNGNVKTISPTSKLYF